MENFGFIIIQLILSLLGFSKTQPNLPPVFHDTLCKLKPAKPTPPENMGIDEITRYPLVLGTKDTPIVNFDIQQLAWSPKESSPIGANAQSRYIVYVKSLPNNTKELHWKLTTPYLKDTKTKGVYTELVNDASRPLVDRTIWSGTASSSAIIPFEGGEIYLVTSSKKDATVQPEKIISLLPTYPQFNYLPATYSVITPDGLLAFVNQSEYNKEIASHYKGTPLARACFLAKFWGSPSNGTHAKLPIGQTSYDLFDMMTPAKVRLALPSSICDSVYLYQIPFTPFRNATTTAFNPDGTNTLEHISLTSKTYPCPCGSKTPVCRTYELTVGTKKYALGNAFNFYRTQSGYMTDFNGDLILLYKGSLYSVKSK